MYYRVSVVTLSLVILLTATYVGQQYVGNTLSFDGNSGNANAPQRYVIRTVHSLLYVYNLDEVQPSEG